MMDSKMLIELTSVEAEEFLLKNESYCNIDLPNYIDFSIVLNKLSKELQDKTLKEICENWKENKPKDIENINHTLLSNKDGLFSWRPLKLIHPIFYILLVKTITNETNWNIIIEKFNNVRNKVDNKIKCYSIPLLSLKEEKDKAVQINNWWNNVEQKSLELSLDYFYITHADIADCYGSIYTHSIPWAIHGKELMKEKRNDNTFVGNQIDFLLQNSSYGQTNGIPQGSTLMDFIAEILLNYIDEKIFEQIENIECKIIRYRDDYRIFTNNEIDGMKVLKILTEVLSEFGMKLNNGKTIMSNNIIMSSVKEDKIYLLGKNTKFKSLQKSLMFIHKLADNYPNSGSVRKELFNFYKKLVKKNKLKENVNALISVIVDIALKNPSTYPTSVAILSKLLSFTKETEKKEIYVKIKNKFKIIPNTGLIDIWLQRIILLNDNCMDIEFEEKICNIIKIKSFVENNLWEIDWLQNKYKEIIKSTDIIKREEIEGIEEIIEIDEIKLFEEKSTLSL